MGLLAVEGRWDLREGRWVVGGFGGERWEWVTVVRKPEGVEVDGRLVLTGLGGLLGGRARGEMGAEDWMGVLEGVRRGYVKGKMGLVG